MARQVYLSGAIHINDVDLVVAVALRSERDPLPIRGPRGIEVPMGVMRHSPQTAAVRVYDVDLLSFLGWTRRENDLSPQLGDVDRSLRKANEPVVKAIIGACKSLVEEKNLDVRFHWQKGHAWSWAERHDPARFNSRADELATLGGVRSSEQGRPS
jgi:hypothetical protein